MARSGRAGVLERALEVCFHGEVDALPEVFTDGVSAWSPNMLATSLGELAEVVAVRDVSLSNVSVQIDALDVVGNKGYAEFRFSAAFTGPFLVDEDTVIEPNGRELMLGAVVVAEFDGDKISAIRLYFDDLSFVEQMLAA